MNKIIYNISLVLLGAGVMTSCSTSDNDIVNNDVINAEKAKMQQLMTEITANSDVPISLSSGSSSAAVTRSVISSTDKGYFETDSLGVFMLANYCFDNSTLNESDIYWTGDGPGKQVWDVTYPDRWSVWAGIDNLMSTAKYVTQGKDTIGTNIVWNDGNVRYYPYGSPFAYSFFAYYPFTPNISKESDYVVATLDNLDGTKDLIWGTATRDSLVDVSGKLSAIDSTAYSAKYYHQMVNRYDSVTAKSVPMKFKHLLSRLNFNIIAGGLNGVNDDKISFSKACGVTIDSISIANAPETVGLVIAAKNNCGYTAGTLPKDMIGARTRMLFLNTKKSDGTYSCYIGEKPKSHVDAKTNLNVADTVRLEGEIMVPPISSADVNADGKNQSYYVQIYVKTEEGEYVKMVIPMELKFVEGGEFKPGYSYNVNLTVYAPETILINATLEKWKKGNDKTIVTNPDGTITVE